MRMTRGLSRIAWLAAACMLLALVAGCGGEPKVIIEEEIVYEVVTNTAEPTVTIEEEIVYEVVTDTPEPTATAVANPTSTARPTRTPIAMPESTPEGPRVLTIGLAAEPESLYVHGDGAPSSRHVQQAYMDGPIDNVLYQYRPVILEKLPNIEDGDAALQPARVEAGDLHCEDGVLQTASQATDAEQMVVTFTLRQGLLWDDGEPLTGHDSVFGWQVFCDQDTPLTDSALCEQTASYRALDDQTVVWTGLPGCVTASHFVDFAHPLPEHILGDLVAQQGAGAIAGSDYARSPTGWGPFKVVEWLPGEYIHLVRNERYFRAAEGLPKVDDIYFRFVPGYERATRELETGGVDIVPADALLPSTYDDDFFPYLDSLFALAANGSIILHIEEYPLWEHIDFNTDPVGNTPAFFDDVRVRQAIAYGTDRQAMIDTALAGRSSVLNSYLAAAHPLHAPDGTLPAYAYDPERARQLLDEAGWALGSDGFRQRDGQKFAVTVITTEAHFRTRLLQVFQQNMRDLGIDVEIEYVSLGDLVARGPDGIMMGRKFNLAEFGWFDRDLEPGCDIYLGSDVPAESNNWVGFNSTGWANAEYDAACLAAMASVDRAEREVLFHWTQEVFAEELPVLPLFLRIKLAATQPGVDGFAFDPAEFGEFWNIEEIGTSP